MCRQAEVASGDQISYKRPGLIINKAKLAMSVSDRNFLNLIIIVNWSLSRRLTILCNMCEQNGARMPSTDRCEKCAALHSTCQLSYTRHRHVSSELVAGQACCGKLYEQNQLDPIMGG
jgi:hypothetical protein